MAVGGQDVIPSINITTDVPSDSPSQHVQSSTHHRQPSGLLSPNSLAFTPPSPDMSDSGSVYYPPSPTLSNLSNLSGHFPSTLQLRDNRPEENSGLSSLGLLNPDFGHRRQLSNATSLTDVARSEDLHHAHSNTTSVTNVDQLPHSPITENVSSHEEDQKSTEKKPKRAKKGPELDDIEQGDLQNAHQTELEQDAAIDPTPFRFKPYELAHMLDPKNIEALVAFGGIHGLLRGLGTNADTGLVTITQPSKSSGNSRDPSLGAGEGASHRHDPVNIGAAENSDDKVPVIVLTRPNETPWENNDLAFSASLEDRRRVYGENLLPTRVTKTLLQLMWIALTDKVLVSGSFAAFSPLILIHLSLS